MDTIQYEEAMRMIIRLKTINKELLEALRACHYVVGGGYIGSGISKKDAEREAAALAATAIRKAKEK